jgi:cob(I)alamin adenosyltransferase
MGNRLSKIVTRTGDDGTTGLADGRRVPKDSARVEAMGAVDELNCAIGTLRAQPLTPELAAQSRLAEIQQQLFDLGGELASTGATLIDEPQVEALESAIEQLNAALPPLREFVLPGGNPAAAACHTARAICRRAERRCWTLARTEPVGPSALRYLNRLSDLLFVLARTLARAGGDNEVLWQHHRRQRSSDTEPDNS